MKQIKLEVGKTYRSREGEEVKIVRKNNKNIFPYQGSNGKLYYEDGKWSYVTEEHPKDLIEEVPEIRHTFAIPDGVKEITVLQEGNRIVLEMVLEKEPKPGDVSRSANTDAMQMSEQNIIMTELETKIWNTVHNWCDEQSSEIPDRNRRYLMDEIKALVLLHVSKSLPIKKYEIDFGGHLLAGLEITNNEPTVIGAMNGWGDGISNDEITITEK